MNAAHLFPATLIAVLCVINVYLARRSCQCLRFLFPSVSFWYCLIPVVLMTLIMIAGFIRSMLSVTPNIKHLLAVASACCMGFFAYWLLFNLAGDMLVLLARIFKPFSLKAPELRFVSGIAVLVLTMATVGFGFLHAQQPKLVNYTVDVPGAKAEKEWNIVLVSDLHLGAVGSEKRIGTIVDRINVLKPDLVCIAGDLFDNDYSAIRKPEAVIETLKQLDAVHGVYACPGNHDAGRTFPQMLQLLDQSGIRVLQDQYTIVGNELVLIGRQDPSPIGGHAGAARRDIHELLQAVDSTLPVVVMDHNPAHISEYPNEVDLIVSGHTHKGQIFPGSLVTNRMYTVDHGYYRQTPESPQVIVTSGAGTWGMPMRVGTDCEIVQIALRTTIQ